MNPVQVQFEYEQADSETELAAKAAKRAEEGWVASAAPCAVKRYMTPEGEVVRLSQAFHRLIFADNSDLQGIMRSYGREAVA
jgi:hypothetical protein